LVEKEILDWRMESWREIACMVCIRRTSFVYRNT
jgi:hypothetical protein